MLKMRQKAIFTLFAVFTFCTCIDPYTPKLTGYASLLVVDGRITDANSSYTVRLSGTFQEQNSGSFSIDNATVSISDDTGNKTFLNNTGNGIYKTDSTEFRGIVGRTYTLSILTNDGVSYESEPCLMQSVPDIDSVYFAKDQQLTNDQTQFQDGVMVFLDSKMGDSNQYLRWDFEEVWKFKVPYPKKFNYILNPDNPDAPFFSKITDVKEFCWKDRKSDEILVYSDYSGSGAAIKKEPVCFIPSDKSDRFTIQYSILVKQYSLSKKEYDFWNNLKQVNVAGGNLFAKQPFTVISNINNINNPKERVLGYFQVSAVKEKRTYLTFGQFMNMGLPYYHNTCERFVKVPLDYPNAFMAPPPTWDDLYTIFCRNSNYYFVEPLFGPGISDLGSMVFARPECADCQITGTRKKPDFWIDIN